jgi:MFS family permease
LSSDHRGTFWKAWLRKKWGKCQEEGVKAQPKLSRPHPCKPYHTVLHKTSRDFSNFNTAIFPLADNNSDFFCTKLSTLTVMPASIELENRAQPEIAATSKPATATREGIESGPSIEEGEITIQQLKPADRGPDAWKLLITAFVFEALLWGMYFALCSRPNHQKLNSAIPPSFPISFGVFQDYYSTLPQFSGDSRIPLIGTIAQGSVYLGAPVAAAVTKRFPKYQRLQIWVGWPLCIFGLVAGSFANTVNGLIATQGVMYGVGFVTLTYPIISMIDEWWVARKGMAFGIISSASGAAGVVMPFIINAMLGKWGYKTSLRAIAVAMAILTGPLIPLLKGRLPAAEQSVMARTNWSFLKKPLFYIYGLSTLFQGLGFFFPPLYLPSYATSIGLSSTQGALILAIMSMAQVLGQFVFGYLSDKKMSVGTLCTICSIMATIASFALWGTAKSIGLLVAFSIVYGFFGFGFSTMRVAMGTCSER